MDGERRRLQWVVRSRVVLRESQEREKERRKEKEKKKGLGGGEERGIKEEKWRRPRLRYARSGSDCVRLRRVIGVSLA